jgi:hypothetical protein
MGTVTDGFFNRLRFGWMNKVVKDGRTDDIVLEDLPLPEEQTSDVAYSQFQTNWEAACKGGKANLRSVLFQTFGRDLMKAGYFKLGWSVCVIMGAFFFTRSLLMFVNGQEPFAAEWKGWILCVFFFVDAWLLGKRLSSEFYSHLATDTCITDAVRCSHLVLSDARCHVTDVDVDVQLS